MEEVLKPDEVILSTTKREREETKKENRKERQKERKERKQKKREKKSHSVTMLDHWH